MFPTSTERASGKLCYLKRPQAPQEKLYKQRDRGLILGTKGCFRTPFNNANNYTNYDEVLGEFHHYLNMTWRSIYYISFIGLLLLTKLECQLW